MLGVDPVLVNNSSFETVATGIFSLKHCFIGMYLCILYVNYGSPL